MSEQANLQVVKDAYAAFGRGDLPAVMDCLADNIEWSSPGTAEIPYAGVFHGKAGVADFFRILADSEDVLFFEPEVFFAQGGRVVALGHTSTRVKMTRRTTQTDWAHSFVLRDGKVTKYREYFDTAQFAEAYREAKSRV